MTGKKKTYVTAPTATEKITNIFSPEVTGTKSPYPTVVIVVTDQYSALMYVSTALASSRFARISQLESPVIRKVY